MKTKWIGIGILFCLLNACQEPAQQKEESISDTPAEATSSDENPAESAIKYAQYFTITTHQDFESVVIKNPWIAGDTLASYALYPKENEAPTVKWAEYVIPVPVDEIVTTSSPHIGLVALLGQLNSIKGVSTDRYLYNPEVYQKVSEGEIKQVGSLKESNLEVLLDLSPDLILKTGMDNVRNDDARLSEAGIPISYNVEWMETNMLARAEWIKFVGAFFQQGEKADSIFNFIEQEYQKALAITTQVNERPSVMTGNNFKGTWYMPSANSYLTKLIKDAGGEYHFKNEASTGSLPLSFEVVLDVMMEADYWVGPRATSLKELEMMDERYTLFKAFRDGNVYTFDKRLSENGGNDYWETGMTRPDLILKDVIKIFHPDLLPAHQLYYYKKLQ